MPANRPVASVGRRADSRLHTETSTIRIPTFKSAQVMRFLPVLLLILPSLAWALPALKDTELYSSKATDCHDVDLKTWQHPARAVLEKHDIKLERVQLCNEGHYPIFTGQVPYDPTGQTKNFFLPLYEEMRKANGKWPYAIVATSDDIVVYVSYPASDGISLDYEQYAEQ